MNKIKWIKDLVIADQKRVNEKINESFSELPERQLDQETLSFLKELKFSFVEVASVFNQMKGSSLGNIKIYSISKTEADFMLFRNHLKLSFVKKHPGLISVTFSRIGEFTPLHSSIESPLSSLDSSQKAQQEEPSDSLNAQPGVFGEFHWFCKGYIINLDYLVRYYFKLFVQRSALKTEKQKEGLLTD